MLDSPALAPLLTRERISPLYFLSYTLIPLSTIAFPHIGIFCLTARKMSHFRRTAVLYPLCILAIWLPSVFLGVAANRVSDVPAIQEKVEAREQLRAGGASLGAEERRQLREKMAADDVMLLLLDRFAPAWLAGVLGAGIMAAVMASDSQILALSTLFTEDIFAFYGGRRRFGEAVQVRTGRVFVIVFTAAAYVIALKAPATIFELAVQYAFSGYAALSVLLFAALFWKRSTKWGALASTLWIIGCVTAISRVPPGTLVLGFHPVVPMTAGSALLMWVVSIATPRPASATLARYFPKAG
jgi:SSS family solute:Na+ symporter